ncbi:MAG: hypothetical protein M1834_009215 [Cirrosporium novae-zelandiae]|nr:MAG: hypothetical protein M1834_009215 [Cirrosporium novae-zelandiae]
MAKPNDEGKVLSAGNHDSQNISHGYTLLPRPAASLVSLVTQSTSASLRLGTLIGGLAIDGARISTLTGLEISRFAVEALLARAGRDVSRRSRDSLGKDEAEGLLEKSINALHLSITSISFLVSTSFHTSSAALFSASTLSQRLLSALDAILGSTESSRAIAAIILLIRREFTNPHTAVGEEKVSLTDLLTGLTCFALLQRWCRKDTEREMQKNQVEDLVWDVVILSNGSRADVIGTEQEPRRRTPEVQRRRRERPASFISASGKDDAFEAIPRDQVHLSGIPALIDTPEDHYRLSEDQIKAYIMQQLPDTARLAINTETYTIKTITVDISGVGAAQTSVSPPPGTALIEDTINPESAPLGKEPLNSHPELPDSPKHRIIFKTTLRNTHSADFQKADDETTPQEHVPDDDQAIKATINVIPDATSDTLVSRSEPADVPASSAISPSIEMPPPVRPAARAMDSEATIKSLHPIQHQDNAPREDIPAKKSAHAISSERNAANQKKSRRPMGSSSSLSGSDGMQRKSSLAKIAQKVRPSAMEKSDKKSSLKEPFKRKPSSSYLPNLRKKSEASSSKTGDPKPLDRSVTHRRSQLTQPGKSSYLPVPRTPPRVRSDKNKELPLPPKQGSPNYFSSKDLMKPIESMRPASRASYYSIHERRRDSFVSQTDTYSLHSVDTRPRSPAQLRTHIRASSSLSKARSEKDRTSYSIPDELSAALDTHRHQRSASGAASIYTMATNNSETSLVLAPRPRQNLLDSDSAVVSLHRNGTVPAMFPNAHFVRNILRFVRFASASYGSNFLRLMGLTSAQKQDVADLMSISNVEHHSFSTYTGSASSTILLSSFVDPQGGSNAAGDTDTNIPLVHYVSLDHESKAVVLTCRGTLGFEDVLTDMMCDYDHIHWRGNTYTVHKGMHASARRLLEGKGGRVVATIKAALEEFPDYGLVLCGHSLGGGVAALLAILISEPGPQGSGDAFVTSFQPADLPLLLTADVSVESTEQPTRITLPPNRPIHVFAYGPPATVSPLLRQATRGLITTIINGEDIVPYLSLGTLRDFQAVALAFKTDDSGAKSEVRRRVWEGLLSTFTNHFYVQPVAPFGSQSSDDNWPWSALKTLRASMLAPKLVPPGEVFVVDAMPVLQRDAFTPRSATSGDSYPTLGRPATRVRLKLVRDVEARFGELRFGSGMLGDHSPGRYEASLKALAEGVLEESS